MPATSGVQRRPAHMTCSVILFVTVVGLLMLVGQAFRPRRPAPSPPLMPPESPALAAESAPVKTWFHEPYVLDDSGTCLVLRIPTWQVLFWSPVGGLIVGAGFFGVFMAGWDLVTDPAAFWRGLKFMCLLPSAAGIWAGWPLVLMPNYRFDRLSGAFTYREPWSWRRPRLARQALPLSRVVGVQVISGGFHEYEDDGYREHYQLNLLLRGAEQRRINLSDTRDLRWTRSAGRRIADWLGVPLVDQVPVGQ